MLFPIILAAALLQDAERPVIRTAQVAVSAAKVPARIARRVVRAPFAIVRRVVR